MTPYILEKYENKEDYLFHWRLRVRLGGRIVGRSKRGYDLKGTLTRIVKTLPFDFSQVEVVWR